MPTSNSLKRHATHLSTTVASTKRSKPNQTITSFFKASTEKGENDSNIGPGLAKFNKEEWVQSLTSEQRELLKLEIDTLEDSWLAHLKDELLTKEFLNLKRFLLKEIASGVEVFPPLSDVYSWSRHTPLHTVKAVILGQDPYHGYGQAHGLCFSVRPPTVAPPSLQNIYIALKKDYPAFQAPPNKGGLLTPWANRGVLMLNTCLTVRARSPNSHSQQGWEHLTQKAIDIVAKVRSRGVVFLAWGKPAAKRVANINREKHYVLQSVHPSPLSAHHGFPTIMISFPVGEVLKQVGQSINQNEPEKRVDFDNHIVRWNEVIQKSAAVLCDSNGETMLRPPKSAKKKEVLRQIALENVRVLNEQDSQKRAGLPIRTQYNPSSLPTPSPLSMEVRQKLKENLPSPESFREPYPLPILAKLEDNVLPLVKAQLWLSPVDGEDSEEVLRDVDMIWDTGAHYTIITLELLSDCFRRKLESDENAPYRSSEGTTIQINASIALSNSPISIEAIALVRPKSMMPNNYIGILFGQRQCINCISHTLIPQRVLRAKDEDVEEGVWGDIILHDYVGIMGDIVSF
ncbi:uracil-DNA glycosylase [Uncinocarpus reesii 1704]|uniref:Uracil-DNA glycosylase n=1 Tax=Uncinocarpus reesii (strain UAMH 1704) TaxID=336963 RepID=C4JT87_UNCRE|nr:uracil-DNA glycosylase [Uncinocarpus reesii 1704]EEP80834.1 uracil-DNA glycosylase [Uncinocarpus reesii 1704]